MLLNPVRIRILEEFLKDYKAKLTGSFIAKKKNLNQKFVAIALKEFEEYGLLKSTLQGKNKLYSINLYDAQIITNFISSIEHLRTIAFYKKQPMVKEIAAKILTFCRDIVVVFGSYAKGTQKKDSDLDLFIVGYCNKKEIEKIVEMYKMDVNIKHYPLHTFKKALLKRDPLIVEIIKDHIIIKNIHEFISLVREIYYAKD